MEDVGEVGMGEEDKLTAGEGVSVQILTSDSSCAAVSGMRVGTRGDCRNSCSDLPFTELSPLVFPWP